MKERILTLIYLFSFFIASSSAQTIIKGKVMDRATLLPVEDANISLSENESPVILSFSASDKQGNYSITYKGKSEHITLTISGFNLKKKTVIVENKNQTVDFLVENEQIRLNEVIVKAPKIRQSGDTLNYNVIQYIAKEDHTIADVLKKMPGIQVRNDGTVLYQNRPINKFYIENLDLLQGRYSIATNNISAKDVAVVQVMENHQPVKALIGKEFVNEAALNLKLKESAKGAFFVKAQTGIGISPLLLSNELMAMYFTRKTQHLSVYKGDNTGRDVTRELQSLYIMPDNQMNLREIIGTVSPSSPDIPQQRYLFNDAHTATINHLNKLGSLYTLTTNLNYVHDKTEKNGEAYWEYLLPDDRQIHIEEIMNTLSRENLLNLAFTLNANTGNYYFNNELKLSASWENEAGKILSNEDNIHQQLKTPGHSITNFFDLVKTTGKKIYKAQSFIGYKEIQQELDISTPILQEVFPSLEGNGAVNQTVNLSAFETRNRISWSTTGRFSMDYAAGINASFQELSSQLAAYDNIRFTTADSLQNRLHRNYIEGLFSASLAYNFTPAMNIRVTFPFRWQLLWRREAKESPGSFFHSDPFVMFNWQVSSMWSSNVIYGLTHLTGDIGKDYTHPILLNYRLLMYNEENLEKKMNHNIMWLIGYKNPFTAFFGSLNLFYNRSRSNLLSDFNYQGVFTTRASIVHPNTSDNLTFSVSAGKEIERLLTTLSLNFTYSGNWSKQISQRQTVNIRNRTMVVSPRIVTRLGSWASFQYDANYSRFQSRLDMPIGHLPSLKSISQNFILNFFPTNNLVVLFRCDYVKNSSLNNKSKTMWFGDVGMKYKMKSIELLLDWNNVFNTSSFVTSSFDNTGRYVYTHRLRPGEVLLRMRFNIL